MIENLQEKFLAHAKERLHPEKLIGKTHAQRIALYKRYMKVEEARIQMHHQSGAGGIEVCSMRAALLDVVLQNLFMASFLEKKGGASEMEKFPLVLIATGGYGRAMLNPGSDVDLLFLVPKSVSSLGKETKDFIEKILYMLWDVGFKVGHAVRSIKEAIDQANTDVETKPALIESRFIIGDKELYQSFQERFQKECIQNYQKEFLSKRLRGMQARHQKYAETVFLQEPNIKQGCGSLRDIHNLFWLSYVIFNTLELKGLVENGVLTKSAYGQIVKGLDFLLRVRNELHYLNPKHPTDILTLSFQGEVATNFAYPQENILHRCEAFMRDYYEHTQKIYHRCKSVLEKLRLLQEEKKKKILFGFLLFPNKKAVPVDGFVAKKGLFYAQDKEIFTKDPGRLIRLFQYTQLRHLELSPSLRILIKRSRHLLNRPFRYATKPRQTFLAILSRKGEVSRTLRQMHHVGVLGRYLPEFGALTFLVQHEFFHRYTADEHTLLCLQKLDELVDTQNPRLLRYQKLFQACEEPWLLYLALILHDAGRAKETSQHEVESTILAQNVCRRMVLPSAHRRTILFLVDSHLILYRTATTQNIEDPQTIAEFARIVENKEYLDLLFLFTYADSSATSDESWSDWKESIISQLYERTSIYLEDQKKFDSLYLPTIEERKEKVIALRPKISKEEIDTHFSQMPRRYHHTQSSRQAAHHLDLFHQFYTNVASTSNKALKPVTKWENFPSQGSSRFSVCTWDRHLLLAKTTGAISAQNLNILKANIFTRSDNVCLDIFRVCTIEHEPAQNINTRKKVEKLLHESLEKTTYDFLPHLDESSQGKKYYQTIDYTLPTHIHIHNIKELPYTLVEIQCPDRLSLLYTIFYTIGSLGYEVVNARVNTEKGVAIDTIGVTDVNEKKLSEDSQREKLLSALRVALEVK